MIDKTPLLVGDRLTAAADTKYTNTSKVSHEHVSFDTTARVEFLIVVVFISIHINSALQFYEKAIVGGRNDEGLLDIAQHCDLVAAVTSTIGFAITVLGQLCCNFRFRLMTSSICIVVALIAQIGSNRVLVKVLTSNAIVYGGGIEMIMFSSMAMVTFLGCALLYFIIDFIRCILCDGISVSAEDEVEGSDCLRFLACRL